MNTTEGTTMEFQVGEKVEFRDVSGWPIGTIVDVSDMHGEYLIRYENKAARTTADFWISAHRVRRAHPLRVI